jgi:hypothetical protein
LTLQLVKDRRCFVCGVENPHGLKLKIVYDGSVAAEAAGRMMIISGQG